MTYEEGILGIPKQFEYQPEVVNKDKLRPFKRIIVLGMGGSRIAADILNMVRPELNIYVHSDYDLPLLDEGTLQSSLIIANSHSGNTDEPISGASMALERGFNLAIVAGNGKLINMAAQHQAPHVVIPHSDLPPRLGMPGHDILALCALIGLDPSEFAGCSVLDAAALESMGTQLSRQLGKDTSLIYTSERLNELGYIWKVILNETAEVPAFSNRFPEANHNEIAGFRGDWSHGFHCVFLKDGLDERVSKRMDLTAELYKERGISTAMMPLTGPSLAQQIISSVILAHWMALDMAKTNNVDPLASSVIEEFKKKI